MLLNAPEMLAVAEMYAGWVERLDFPRLDAFKATYEPPNSPPTQSSFFSDRQLFQITGPWGVQSLADYKPDMNYTVTQPSGARGGRCPRHLGGWFRAHDAQGGQHVEGSLGVLQVLCGLRGAEDLDERDQPHPHESRDDQGPGGMEP